VKPAPTATRSALLVTALVVSILGLAPARSSAQSNGVECLRQANPSPPPDGGVVFARPLDQASSKPNVVRISAGSSWDATACGGSAEGAGDVMTHPSSIAVAPDAAVWLQDEPAGLVSAWGAKNVQDSDKAPVLFPGRSDWTTTRATATDPENVLNLFNSCRACSLPDVDFEPTQAMLPSIAYEGDVSGADLTGATLHGTFDTWNFTGTKLNGAKFMGASLAGSVLDRTVVDDTSFDGSDLRGARVEELRYAVPPSFAGVRVGPFNGSCTVFGDTDLVNARLTPVKPDPGCESSPLLPDSAVPMSLLRLLVETYHANLDFRGARFVADAGDRGDLAGADLHGVNLAGASFIGFPADFSAAHFDGAPLQKTSFELADLAGATFQDAHAAGASFQDARLAAHGGLTGASFAGSMTDVSGADFVAADISGASFQGATLSGAVFNRALAVNTDFNSVTAENTVFSGAHVYGDGQAFDNARDLRGADFGGAVLAADVNQSGGFDFTGTDLTKAKFDAAQCISCNFTGATLTGVNFSGADLPGVVLAGAQSLSGADLTDAWLSCGDANSACAKLAGSPPQWAWPLALGSQEFYGPVPFGAANLAGVSLDDVAACPDGKAGAATPPGCDGHLLPDGTLTVPAPCTAASLDTCPTTTKTLYDATSTGAPLAVVAATPPTWSTTLTGRGYYVGLDDHTVRLVGDSSQPKDSRLVAGSPGKACPSPTDACGDGNPASRALLGTPAALALGLDGDVYVADPDLHRVRRIDASPQRASCTVPKASCGARSRTARTAASPSAGQITTVAGNGKTCDPTDHGCGDGGPATAASLAGPYGVWVDPSGHVFIADGHQGIREVQPDGTIATVAGSGSYDIRSVTGDPSGDLYATTPDYLLKVDLPGGKVTRVVGTGTSGYNGNTGSNGLLPGDQVQINHPGGPSVALDGNVVFTDTANNLVRAYVPRSNHVINLAGVVANGSPQGGFTDDGQPANKTELDHPQAMTVTRSALFVVADTHNRRVRQFGPTPPAGGAR
jgi:uncharacterized protein YjbI with pentapeptide repeats